MELKVKYVNQSYNLIKLESKEDPYKLNFETIFEKVEKDSHGDEYRLFIEKSDNVYTFGAEQLFDSYDEKAGYVWSSNSGVINKMFGTKLIEVCINGCSRFSMDVDDLKPLIEEYWGCPVRIEKKEDEDSVQFEFVKEV